MDLFVVLLVFGMIASAGMTVASFRLDMWEIQLGFIPLWAIILAALHPWKTDRPRNSHASEGERACGPAEA